MRNFVFKCVYFYFDYLWQLYLYTTYIFNYWFSNPAPSFFFSCTLSIPLRDCVTLLPDEVTSSHETRCFCVFLINLLTDVPFEVIAIYIFGWSAIPEILRSLPPQRGQDRSHQLTEVPSLLSPIQSRGGGLSGVPLKWGRQLYRNTEWYERCANPLPNPSPPTFLQHFRKMDGAL